ncbi:MAG: type IV secretory system conjugative DNA transfer family protein [Solirubrobacteraceae bacterium]
MNPGPPSRRRRPYWLMPVFAALMLSPPARVTVAVLSAAIGVVVALGARRIARARAAQARAADDGVALGVDAEGRQVVLSDHQLSAHGLILGASGAGKSTTLLRILTDHVARRRPVIAIDMKGSPSFAAELQAAAAAAGRPFLLWSIDGPSYWNPLSHGNPTELKDRLIATERFSEPHYKRAAERYAQMALSVLAHGHPGRPPTIAEMVTAMDSRRIPGMLRDLPRPLALRVQDYLTELTPDQLSAVKGLRTRLALMAESAAGPFLEPARDGGRPAQDGGAEIDLRAALSGDPIVVFSLNSSRYPGLAAQIGTMVIQDLVSATGERLSESHGRPLPHALVGIDEFSALGADHLVHLVARGREPGLSVVLATQEFADMERAARGLRDQLVGNAAVKIIHRQDVPDSALMAAQLVGTHQIWERTIQTGGGLLCRYDTRRGTRRLVERFVIHPNQIKRLTTGEAIVITKQPTAQARAMRVRPPQPWGRELG